MFPNRIAFVAVVALAAGISGCGSAAPTGPAVFPVTGNIKVGGKPLANVNVQLIPTDPQKPAGAAKTDANGNYTITNADGRKGSVAGNYKFVLKVVSDGASSQTADMYAKSTGAPGAGPAAAETPFPAEYSEAAKTPKEVTVEAKPNVFDLAL